jgi:UDP-N-acetylmuramate dehydrogenase
VQPLRDVPLAPRTTLGVGGQARHLVRVQRVEEVSEALAWAGERGLPLFVLGGGSNLLVSDEGFPGLVVDVGLRGLSFRTDSDDVLLRVAAGEVWDEVVARAVGQGWSGIECLSGIPGLAGAAPIQNIGAYGQEVATVVERVEAFDLASGSSLSLAAAECAFAYRQSRFKREPGRHLVTAVELRLRPGRPDPPRYAELARELGSAPSLAEVRAAVLRVRRRKAMVVDALDPDSRSAGSFFVNPVVEEARALEIARAAGEQPPHFPAPGGCLKLPAAWLIERAGFSRGHRRGRAGISSKHALALVNLGGASAAEVVELAREIRRGVLDRFGVLLEPEPVLLGLEL